MSRVKICRICLRTDLDVRDIDEFLADFHDEICNYDIYKNRALKYCAVCEYQLKKFYSFRERCTDANRILKTWRVKNGNKFPTNLYELLRPTGLGYWTGVPGKNPVIEIEHSDDGSPLGTFIKSESGDLGINSNIFIFIGDQPHATDPVTTVDCPVLEKNDVKEKEFTQRELTEKELTAEEFTEKELTAEEFTEKKLTAKEFPDKELTEKEETEQKNSDTNAQLSQDLAINSLKEEGTKSDEEWNHDFLESDYDDEVVAESYAVKVEETKVSKKKKISVAKVKTKRGRASKAIAELVDVKYEEIDDISLADLVKNCVDEKTVKARQKFLKNKAKLKDRILEILATGNFDDLGNNIKMNKDIFLKIFNRYDKCDMRMLTIKPDAPELGQKLRKFLLYLLRRYNPEYETVFEVEYLDTEEKRMQEFHRRKDNKAYVDAPYKCQLCFKGFDAESHLDYHNKWHKPTPNDIVCNICPMRFLSKPTYKAHRKNNHTVVYTCKLCPVVTYHFSVMENHYNQHKGVEYSCPTCLSVYTNKTTLNNHRREAHATSHICTACARSFVSEKGLYFHRKYKHKDEAEAKPEEAATCLECNITFDSHKVYIKHERTMHTRRPETVYKCYFCKDGFDSIEALRQHKLEFNHQRAPKQLIHRTSIGAAPRGSKRTRRTRASDPDSPYRTCPVCLVEVPNSFPTSLYMHYQEAHPEVPYASVYTDSKDYLCEQCGKTFRVYCHYLDHRNQHTGAKPYACRECGAHFATRKHLAYHAERHRPPRYQCKQCGKLFLSAANLFAHRRGHIGDRRFKCEICFKGFLHSYTLKEHIKGVHNQIRRVRKTKANM